MGLQKLHFPVGFALFEVLLWWGTMPAHRFQILALDVDGTLLGPDGTLRPRTLAAVTRAARAGIRPVLCTGRRYRRAWPIARQLEIDAPLVCNSGAIIKDPTSDRTVWRADFDGSLSADVLDLFRSHDQPAVVFTDRGPDEADLIVAAYPTGREDFDDYVGQNREHSEINERWCLQSSLERGQRPPERGGDSLFHICAIGTRADMLEFQAAAHHRIAGRIQTYVQRMPRVPRNHVRDPSPRRRQMGGDIAVGATLAGRPRRNLRGRR